MKQRMKRGVTSCFWMPAVIAVFALAMTADAQVTPTAPATANMPAEVEVEPAPQPAVPAPVMAGSDDLAWMRQRLAEQVQQLSAAAGPHDESARAATQRLDELAMQLGTLGAGATNLDQRVEAQHLQISVYHALAQRAASIHDERDVAYRASQWRTAAIRLKQLDHVVARGVSDFWLLQADLFDLTRSSLGASAVRQQSIERIERFLRDLSHPQDAALRRMRRQTQISLLRLYDQLGSSEQAIALLARIREEGDVAGTDPVKQLARQYICFDAIGQQFNAELVLDDGSQWAGEGQRGKVLLLHFHDPSAPGSAAILRRLRAVHDEQRDRLSILTVHALTMNDAVGDPIVGAAATAWPAYSERYDRVSLTRMFSVAELPRFVLIDPAGVVVSIASTAVIVDRIPAMVITPSTTGSDISLPAVTETNGEQTQAQPTDKPMQPAPAP